MVHVKLFGVFRLDSGVKELDVSAATPKDIYPQIIAEAKRINPKTRLNEKDLRGCVISVNGRQVKPGSKLNDGVEVILVPAVAGG